MKEYMYFANCENPKLAYLKYREDKNKNIIYHSQMSGFCDLLIIAKEKIDVDGDIIFEGPRPDLIITHPNF